MIAAPTGAQVQGPGRKLAPPLSRFFLPSSGTEAWRREPTLLQEEVTPAGSQCRASPQAWAHVAHLAWFCLSTSQQRPWVLLCEWPGAGSVGGPWTTIHPSPTAPSPGWPRRSILLSIRSFIRRVSPEIPLCPRRMLEMGTAVLKGPGWGGVGEPVFLENHPPAPSVHHLSSPPGCLVGPVCPLPLSLVLGRKKEDAAHGASTLRQEQDLGPEWVGGAGRTSPQK